MVYCLADIFPSAGFPIFTEYITFKALAYIRIFTAYTRVFTTMVPQSTRVQFCTRLPIAAEHVSLRTLTGKGSVHVDAGVFTTMVTQQAVIHPGAGLEVLVDEEAF